jgi:hypothetical protein
VFAHEPLQDVNPAEQPHALPLQISPGSHKVPQAPQLRGLFVVLMQTGGSPQACVFVGQAQAPAWQVRPPVQTTPQAPQFAWSV